MTLFIPCEAYQDRVTVTLSCLIVMAAFFTQISSSLPLSADPKLIDVWMFTHVCILFLVFEVHIIIIFLFIKSTRMKEEEEKKENKVYPFQVRISDCNASKNCEC
ncbi:UNVERIFIED_CONTAM: hypothetical protein GTU68_029340 [Idotea baltica]|nr:hypothetical protein [Idotea baltica]